MGGDSRGPSQVSYRLARCPPFRVLFICKSMEMAFRTKQSVRIVVHVDGRISGVCASQGSTVVYFCRQSYKPYPSIMPTAGHVLSANWPGIKIINKYM